MPNGRPIKLELDETLQMWSAGLTRKEMAFKVSVSMSTIDRRLCELRLAGFICTTWRKRKKRALDTPTNPSVLTSLRARTRAADLGFRLQSGSAMAVPLPPQT